MGRVAQTVGRTSSGARNPNAVPSTPPAFDGNTEITIIRNGGVNDKKKEEELRKKAPESIVMEARTAVEKAAANPIKVLMGHQAHPQINKKTGQPIYTGNFVYTIAGEIPFERVQAFGKALCEPLLTGRLMPVNGWRWIQIRGVPNKDATSTIYNTDQLNAKLRNNASFANVTICIAAHFQENFTRVTMDHSSTVQVAYMDITGEITTKACDKGLVMFGATQAVTELPAGGIFMQCGRCHALTHRTGGMECPLTKYEVKCFRCGGSHDTSKHAFYCPTSGQNTINHAYIIAARFLRPFLVYCRRARLHTEIGLKPCVLICVKRLQYTLHFWACC
jgi:hypothetical protein